MTWRRIPITAGVVNTRSPASMRLGECEYIKNARLKPGDLSEIHRDFGRSELFSVTAPEEIIHAFVASFESAGEFIVLVTADGTNVYIKTASVTGGGLTTRATYAHGGTVTKAGHQHRGDEHFIGTDATTQRLFVLSSDLSVREMGMAPSYDMTSDAANIISVLPFAGPPGGATTEDDTFVYWVTEYDSVNDVESEPAAALGQYNIVEIAIANTGDNHTVVVNASYVLQNPNADKLRIYRHFCGNATTDADDTAGQVAAYQNGDAALVGGLVGEITYSTTSNAIIDYIYGVFDPVTPYPLAYYSRAGVTLIGDYLDRPRKWHVGALFNDSLVLTSGTLGRFSPPSEPEIQPGVNAFYFLTERSDEIVALYAVNDSLVALSAGGVHRVDYLQHDFNIASAMGKAQRTISTLDGCVGRYAHTQVDIEGELRSFVAFLSHTGLRMTDGQRVFDACPDWSVTGAGIASSDLASCVLLADPANHRLRLFVPNGTVSDIWDFYYHGSLLAEGRFRALGPSPHTGLVVTGGYGYVNGSPTLFTASATTVWKEGVGETASNIEVFTGWVRPAQSPMNELVQHALGIEHDADSDGVITLTGYGKIHGQAEVSAGGAAPTSTYEEASYAADAGLRGNRLRSKVVVSGHSRLGPLLMDLEEEQGGAA